MSTVIILDEGFEIGAARFIPLLEKVVGDLSLPGTITIKIGGSEESRRLNTEFLEKEYPTDVLSFPIGQEMPDGYYLGDVFICLPVAAEQAGSQGHSLERELFILMVHGILHLAGHDHETDGGELLALQAELVARIWKED